MYILHCVRQYNCGEPDTNYCELLPYSRKFLHGAKLIFAVFPDRSTTAKIRTTKISMKRLER